MQLAKPGLTTLSLPKVIPKYYQQYILTFVKLHHTTLRCISFPTFSSAMLYELSLFTPTNFFLTELDISEDKSLNVKQLRQALAYLKNNSTLKKLILAPKSNLSLKEKGIREQIESELSYNEQLDVAHVVLAFFLEMYKESNKESSNSLDSRRIDLQILKVIMSFLLGDELYPQRLAKGIDLNSSSLTIFGTNFRQSELLETKTAARLQF